MHEEKSKSGFTIVDRRGEKKERRVDPVAEPVEAKDKSSWKSVGFILVLTNNNGNIIPVSRAVGLRSDDMCCIADWIIAPINREGTDITDVPRKRLDTFLNCECESHKLCGVHQNYMRQWMEADADRLNRISQESIPEALEVMMKAEQARRQTGIVVPR